MSKLINLNISLLNDYYGALLTKYQSRLVSLYYDEDLSLAEIAKICETSRQAVRDVIVRAAAKLNEYEQKLCIVAKVQEIKKDINTIMVSKDTEVKNKLLILLEKVKQL